MFDSTETENYSFRSGLAPVPPYKGICPAKGDSSGPATGKARPRRRAMAYRRIHAAKAAFVFSLLALLCVIQSPVAVAFSGPPLLTTRTSYVRVANAREWRLEEPHLHAKQVAISEQRASVRGSKQCSVGALQMSADDEDERESGSTTLFRDGWGEVTQGIPQHEQSEPANAYGDESLMSASHRTLHRDLYSWRDIYDWYTSYHAPMCAGEAGLQLRRDLYEALRVGDMAQAGRIREEILAIDSRDDVTRLQDELDSAVRNEVGSPLRAP